MDQFSQLKIKIFTVVYVKFKPLFAKLSAVWWWVS